MMQSLSMSVSQIVWAVIINYLRLYGLNNKHLFCTVLGTRKSKIRCQPTPPLIPNTTSLLKSKETECRHPYSSTPLFIQPIHVKNWFFTFMHWRRQWQPTPVFLPGESQGRGSLVGCRLWGHRVGHD